MTDNERYAKAIDKLAEMQKTRAELVEKVKENEAIQAGSLPSIQRRLGELRNDLGPRGMSSDAIEAETARLVRLEQIEKSHPEPLPLDVLRELDPAAAKEHARLDAEINEAKTRLEPLRQAIFAQEQIIRELAERELPKIMPHYRKMIEGAYDRAMPHLEKVIEACEEAEAAKELAYEAGIERPLGHSDTGFVRRYTLCDSPLLEQKKLRSAVDGWKRR